MKVYLYTYESQDFPSEHKIFSSLQAAKNYLFKEIGEYLLNCIEDEDNETAYSFLENAEVILPKANDDNLVYYFCTNGDEYYVEELTIKE